MPSLVQPGLKLYRAEGVFGEMGTGGMELQNFSMNRCLI